MPTMSVSLNASGANTQQKESLLLSDLLSKEELYKTVDETVRDWQKKLDERVKSFKTESQRINMLDEKTFNLKNKFKLMIDQLSKLMVKYLLITIGHRKRAR